jgi:two-component system phosphate regulon sensor histidine kinase PhoR
MLDSQDKDSVGKSVFTLRRDQPFRMAIEEALDERPCDCMLEGAGRHIALYASPVPDYGEASGAVLLLLDVTEREDREKLRREFTANVSHELKTPLTAISGYAEIISNGIAKSSDAPEFASKIYAEAQRMILMIGDILLLSKLDEGAVLDSEQIELHALALGVSARLAETSAARGIGVKVTGERASIIGSGQMIDEMLYNLVENSIKYNVEGGSIEINTRQTSDSIVLSVKDTGIGISPSERERVFERFYRTRESLQRSIAGTGLGLSIVKHAAMLHNGKIELESDEMKGTTIAVSFPKPR